MRQRTPAGQSADQIQVDARSSRPYALVLLAIVGTLALLPSSALAAGPPTITAPTFSAVTETSATLQATVDPAASNLKKVHFDYIPLALYIKDGKQFGEGTLTTALEKIPAEVKGKGDLSAATGEGDLSAATGEGDLVKGSTEVTGLTTTKGAFAVDQTISSPGIPQGTTITAIGATTLTLSAAATEDQAPASLQAGSKTITGVVVTSSKGAFAAGQRLEPTKGLPNGASIESVGEGTLTINQRPDESATGVALQAGSGLITNLTTTNEGTFAKRQTISGKGIPAGAEIAAVESGQLELAGGAIATEANNGVELRATGAQPFSQTIAGLTPATAYRVRLSVENKDDEVFTSPEATLQTVIPASIFEPCPNDPFRSGAYAPFGHPSALLPDCRAYEQATPVDKDGGDLALQSAFAHAAGEGAGVTFGTTFGVPGGQGAQGFPFYAAMRGEGEAGWSSKGLLPPGATGDKAAVRGWLPDFSATFAEATRLGKPRTHAFFELHRDGSAPTQITPYVAAGNEYGSIFYAGATKGAGEVVFETPAALPPAEGQPLIDGAAEGAQNVYAWDAASGLISLASVLNSPEETEAALPKGAFAGPYDWNRGNSNAGGPGNETYNYLQDRHAVSEDGSVHFTAAGTGQLYERLNPTQPQSAVIHPGEPNEECTEFAKACTIHVSASKRTPVDPGGSQPAALQFATPDGTKAFLTSSEELTADANTGPVQEPAQIGRIDVEAEDPQDTIEPGFLPAHALGVAVDPKGEYIYWADPISHSIGRANLKAPDPKNTIEPDYIVPGDVDYEVKVPFEGGGVFEYRTPRVIGPSTPRYVAVDETHVYWTNTGPLTDQGFGPEPTTWYGSIGRAKIGEDKGENPDPKFIIGLSDPQGIAVSDTKIYWATNPAAIPNVSEGEKGAFSRIGRATLDGGEVEPEWTSTDSNSNIPRGMKIAGGRLYYAAYNDQAAGYNLIASIPLTGVSDPSDRQSVLVGTSGIRDMAVVGQYVLWVTDTEHNIGRIPLAEIDSGFCNTHPNCDNNYIPIQGSGFGLASDGTHLYFSTNGETPPNPGNDLYRYEVGSSETLTDLTPDSNPGEENGAEVQGFLGASPDGSYLYFVANGDLDEGGPAHPGDCERHPDDVTKLRVGGECNLYLWHGGQSELIARLRIYSEAEGRLWSLAAGTDAAPRPKASFLSADGKTLLFSSASQLTDYDNAGAPELYRYRVGEGISCTSCDPTGIHPTFGPGFQGFDFPGSIGPPAAAAGLELHLLSADGNRAFFSTTEALVTSDTDGSICHPTGSRFTPSCQDVYEWEAAGAGTCTENGPAYSSTNEGCLYLISTGKGQNPASLLDASPSGSDVYILTRESLVGQDTDSITDIYDARTGGGLTAQNPIASPPCEGEGCKGPNSTPPSFSSPPQFAGPADPKPKRPKHPCKKAKGKKKGGCHKKHPHKKRKQPK